MSDRLVEPSPSWHDLLADMRDRWHEIDRPLGGGVDPSWPEQLRAMVERMQELQRLGRWTSGPHDLLSIVGLNRWELAHSAALAWLCSPDAAHGLGARFLEALIAETGDPVSLQGPVESRTEVSRARSIADVIVEGSGWALVIEVKVDAREQPSQAERLFNDWQDRGDVRFLFLSRGQAPPTTAGFEARKAWVPVSWRRVRTILATLADTSEPSALARGALTEYLGTLDHTF